MLRTAPVPGPMSTFTGLPRKILGDSLGGLSLRRSPASVRVWSTPGSLRLAPSLLLPSSASLALLRTHPTAPTPHGKAPSLSIAHPRGRGHAHSSRRRSQKPAAQPAPNPQPRARPLQEAGPGGAARCSRASSGLPPLSAPLRYSLTLLSPPEMCVGEGARRGSLLTFRRSCLSLSRSTY